MESETQSVIQSDEKENVEQNETPEDSTNPEEKEVDEESESFKAKKDLLFCALREIAEDGSASQAMQILKQWADKSSNPELKEFARQEFNTKELKDVYGENGANVYRLTK